MREVSQGLSGGCPEVICLLETDSVADLRSLIIAPIVYNMVQRVPEPIYRAWPSLVQICRAFAGWLLGRYMLGYIAGFIMICYMSMGRKSRSQHRPSWKNRLMIILKPR